MPETAEDGRTFACPRATPSSCGRDAAAYREQKPASGKEAGFLGQDPGDISGVVAVKEVGGGWLSSGFKMKPHPSWPRRSGGLPVPEPFEKVDETFLNAQRGLVYGFFVLGGYWAGAF